MAEASGRGAEESDCDESDERTFSEATAQGSVEEDRETADLAFMYRLNSQGGHYRTADGCLGNVLVGIHGNDTRAAASIDLLGRIEFSLPAETVVRVSWQGFLAGYYSARYPRAAR